MRRLAILGGMIALMLLPGAASGASLLPIAEPAAWGTSPIFVTAPTDDQRVFVVERGGGIRVVEDGAVKPQPFLTIPGVDTVSERGLLSMAFAPDYATTGLFYVFYTGAGGEIRIVEYQLSASDPDVADPSTARPVLTTPHSAGNHNGGWMAFGPDGKLYITIGDNAVSANAQALGNILGKVLRIDPADPDEGGPLTATIPPDNPFVGTPGARGEIYTYGLRNPYRASFAPNGDLTIGDVGDGTTEEVNAGDLAGKNMGWPICEGFCDTPNPGFTEPVFEYPIDHVTNCAVIGGHVVRDPDLTGLTGRYIYGDLCADDLRTLNLEVAGADPGGAGLTLATDQGILLSFGEDSVGCSYVITNESVYRIAPTAVAAADCPRTAPPPPPPPPGPPPTGPPPPGPSPNDVTFDFYTAPRKPLAKRISVAGRCSIECDLKATGTVRISRNRFRQKPGRIKLRTATSGAAAGARTRLSMTMSARAIKKVRRAARSGSRITAFVKVSAVAEDGSGGSGSGAIRLIPARRR